MRARLEPVAGACRRARELVTDACARWNLPDASGPAALVLSELVGNVVRHAGTPMQVTVTLRRPYLHLAVVDGSSAQAREGGTDLHAEGGRGLLLVRELTQRWGSVPAGQGKAVWAMLPAT
jgi:anti-sigma regulatory factor (Ser/Thr protein kinase)